MQVLDDSIRREPTWWHNSQPDRDRGLTAADGPPRRLSLEGKNRCPLRGQAEEEERGHHVIREPVQQRRVIIDQALPDALVRKRRNVALYHLLQRVRGRQVENRPQDCQAVFSELAGGNTHDARTERHPTSISQKLLTPERPHHAPLEETLAD